MSDEMKPAAMPEKAVNTPGFRRMFASDRLTLGLFYSIESYSGDMPTMKGQLALTRKAEEGGFAALWVRDVPLRDPSFGDLGQIYDPWVWLGYILPTTGTIALATGAIILPLRQPLDIAKAAASIDVLSGGRLVLGVASGDRPVEFPAYGRSFEQRGELFREALAYMRQALETSFPMIDSPFGLQQGSDLIPKPRFGHIPIAVTGNSQQSLDGIAENSDAWVMYPRSPNFQQQVIKTWRDAVEQRAKVPFKPLAQSLYIDLTEDPHAPPKSIHLGYSLGRVTLIEVLGILERIGVNHVIFNLKYGKRPAAEVVDELCREVVPHFPANLLESPGRSTELGTI